MGSGEILIRRAESPGCRISSILRENRSAVHTIPHCIQLNLLARINRELGADFDLSRFPARSTLDTMKQEN